MTDIARASDRSRRLYRSRNFQKAYVSGARAALGGHSESTCPYDRDSSKTWLTAYRKAWMRGFQSIARSA